MRYTPLIAVVALVVAGYALAAPRNVVREGEPRPAPKADSAPPLTMPLDEEEKRAFSAWLRRHVDEKDAAEIESALFAPQPVTTASPSEAQIDAYTAWLQRRKNAERAAVEIERQARGFPSPTPDEGAATPVPSRSTTESTARIASPQLDPAPPLTMPLDEEEKRTFSAWLRRHVSEHEAAILESHLFAPPPLVTTPPNEEQQRAYAAWLQRQGDAKRAVVAIERRASGASPAPSSM